MTIENIWQTEKLGDLAKIKTGSKNNQDKNPGLRVRVRVRVKS